MNMWCSSCAYAAQPTVTFSSVLSLVLCNVQNRKFSGLFPKFIKRKAVFLAFIFLGGLGLLAGSEGQKIFCGREPKIGSVGNEIHRI